MLIKGPGIWSKLATGFFLLAILPLLVMGCFIFQDSKKDLIRSQENYLYSVLQLQKQRIEDFTDSALDTTVMLSEMPRIKDLMDFLLNRTGQDKESALRELRSTLMSFLRENGSVEAYFLLHPETGEVLCSNDIYQEGKFFDKRPYFASGREAPSIYRVHYSHALEKSILALSAPVHDHGRLMGVMVSWVNLDKMSRVLDIDPGVNSYLVNRSNLHIVEPYQRKGRLNIHSGIFTYAAVQALSRQSGTGVYPGHDGVDVVGAYSYVLPLDLALIVELPLEATMEGINIRALKIILLVLGLALVVLLAAVLAGRTVASPLIRISRRAEELASGSSSEPIEVTSTDEFGTLNTSMNRLAESLVFKENELKHLISTMDTMVEHIPEGFVLLDADDKVVHANPMGEAYLRELTGVGVGERLSEIQGKPIDDFMVSPPHIVWQEVKTESPMPIVFEVATRRIGHKEDAGSGNVLMLKDVTRAREIETRMQAQERLAAVGHLASGIAHDFNNILTCVIGYSEMLIADSVEQSETRSAAEAILQSGKRAEDLIGQILDFSRRSSSEFKSVDLRTLSKEFLKFIERLLPENINISVEFDPGDYLLRADITKMLQVFANLAVNARDAMPDGGDLRFEISHEEMPSGSESLIPDTVTGHWILVKISDTGNGIPPEVIPHIFEPFFTTKPKERGSGLGLAQVYGIVKQHGGYIDVTSGQGQGATFWIYLPLAEPEAQGDKTEETEPDESPQQAFDASDLTVMVVEDDSIVREMLSKELQRLGFTTIEAQSGHEGLRAFRESPAEVDLVITDVVMPGMDGLEMSRELQKIRPGIRVIAITGYTVSEGNHSLEDIGIVEWVEKPFNIRTLYNVISKVLSTGTKDTSGPATEAQSRR